MSDSIEIIKKELQGEIDLRSESHDEPSNMALFGIFQEMLSGSGQILDDDLNILNSRSNNVHFAAYSRDIERSEIHVFTTQYISGITAEKVYKKDVESFFAKTIQAFINLKGEKIKAFDPFDPIVELFEEFSERRHHWNKVVIWMCANSVYGSREGSSITTMESGLSIVFNFIDLKYYQSLLTDKEVSKINISTEIPAIKVLENDSYSSYLFSLSGYELCTFYDQYGKRLLESNVRTFLSLRGSTNKGIYNTIHMDLERPFFFAYNNGLTATSSAVNYRNSKIYGITDLQIVNGGQTMSTIYKAWKDGKTLDNVFVQVKLNVIHDLENKDTFVSRISRFANTQNKVNNSDFFSNSYYHRTMKVLSSKIRVTKNGQLTPEKWFYERVRGEYVNDQLFLSQGLRNRFKIEYPQSNVFDKIAVAKAYLSVNELPYLVSRGAQLCFAEFAKRVSDLYDEANILDEAAYKQIIAQVILFRAFEKRVSNSNWYTGGYRAQTVAYTIALYVNKLKTINVSIDWMSIWNGQNTSSPLIIELDRFGEAVHEKLINPPPGNTNIGTYSKREPCWVRVKELKIKPEKGIDGIRSFGQQKTGATKKSKALRPETGIAAQLKVMELAKTDMPKKLLSYYNSKHAPLIRDRDRSIISSWHEGRIGYPSEIQAKIIMNVIKKAEEAGL